MVKPSRTNGLAKAWLLFCIFLALFGDFIANERPVWLTFQGETYFPALKSIFQSNQEPIANSALNEIRLKSAWYTLRDSSAGFAPVPFSAGKFWQDSPGALLPPLSRHPDRPAAYLHLLGTDMQGRDVTAAFVHGARIALLTGLWASALAFVIGLLIGVVAGYFGDNRLYLPRYFLLFSIFALPFSIFYAFLIRQWPEGNTAMEIILRTGIFLITEAIFVGLGFLMSQKISFLAKSFLLPADLLLMRFAEIINSVPRLLLIVATATLWRGQAGAFWVIISMIGIFGWTGIARFARAELLKVRESDYVSAARSLGLSNWSILWKHALPNILSPIKTALILSFGTSIMLEASISFLGYGDAGMDGATWGSLLNAYRDNRQGWWLLAVPFIGICATLLSLNQLANSLEDQNNM